MMRKKYFAKFSFDESQEKYFQKNKIYFLCKKISKNEDTRISACAQCFSDVGKMMY